jgi:hypothetical protein
LVGTVGVFVDDSGGGTGSGSGFDEDFDGDGGFSEGGGLGTCGSFGSFGMRCDLSPNIESPMTRLTKIKAIAIKKNLRRKGLHRLRLLVGLSITGSFGSWLTL